MTVNTNHYSATGSYVYIYCNQKLSKHLMTLYWWISSIIGTTNILLWYSDNFSYSISFKFELFATFVTDKIHHVIWKSWGRNEKYKLPFFLLRSVQWTNNSDAFERILAERMSAVPNNTHGQVWGCVLLPAGLMNGNKI